MWLRKGDQTVLVPEHMRDTIARCLSDGWTEISDPTIQPAPEPAPEPMRPELVAQVEQERIAAILANNDAARAAFDEMGMGPKPKGGRR